MYCRYFRCRKSSQRAIRMCLAEWYRCVPKGRALRPETATWDRSRRPIHCCFVLVQSSLRFLPNFATRAVRRLTRTGIVCAYRSDADLIIPPRCRHPGQVDDRCMSSFLGLGASAVALHNARSTISIIPILLDATRSADEMRIPVITSQASTRDRGNRRH